MDLNEFRSFILDSGLDIWTWIDMSISVACADHENELRNRRDGIIQRLYAARCQNCDYQFSRGSKCNFKEIEGHPKVDDVPAFDYNNTEKLQSGSEEDDERKGVLEIKILLEDLNQSERCLIGLLHRLVGMRTTFKTLKETDIGRHVSRLRKHSSNEVRRLVKFLVRKWKDTVDEWVRLNTPMESDDKRSPTPIEVHCEGSIVISENTSVSCHFTPPKETMKHNPIESDYKSSSAKKRLHDQTFQETQHAKKQITSDFHNIPKPKNNAVVQVNNSGGKYW